MVCSSCILLVGMVKNWMIDLLFYQLGNFFYATSVTASATEEKRSGWVRGRVRADFI